MWDKDKPIAKWREKLAYTSQLRESKRSKGHLKKRFTSFVIKEIPINTTMRYHHILIRLAKNEKFNNSQVLARMYIATVTLTYNWLCSHFRNQLFPTKVKYPCRDVPSDSFSGYISNLGKFLYTSRMSI